MRHTLKEYLNTYNPTTIQLVYGMHIVNIDTTCRGSNSLLKVFENEKFLFTSCKNNHLLLDYIGAL